MKKMNILVIGGGGREHALVWKLSQSPSVTRLYASPGSDAIGELAECVELTTQEDIASFAKANKLDLVVVGPEAPLVSGLVDHLQSQGIKAFGPTAAAARLEGSKTFAKDFMHRHAIPTAAHWTFTSPQAALNWVEENPPPCVVKADGLAAGKGVAVCHTRQDARDAIHRMMVDKAFGEAGSSLVIETLLTGGEASYFVITDGTRFVALPPCQDHKPVGDLDRGPNTGGMGAFCPTPLIHKELEERILAEIVRPTLEGMAAEGHPYTGVLYVGLMIQDGHPFVVEYNCRFGDPECQPLMLMLDGDLAELLNNAVEGRLDSTLPQIKPGSAACIVMAAGEYPGDVVKGHPIRGLADLEPSDQVRVFHGGTRHKDGRWTTDGGRVLGVTAWGETLAEALEKGYLTAGGITWDDCRYRRDIGLKGLKTRHPSRPATNVAVLLGSASDLPVANKATAVLDSLGIGYELAVASAHRTPQRVKNFIRNCELVGVEVFIAMAGMSAALPGVVASETLLPVIGVPISSQMDGLDALLSMVQMPPGIPVATVAVGGGVNSAMLAAHILAVKYPDIRAALTEYRLAQTLKVAEDHQAAGLSDFLL